MKKCKLSDIATIVAGQSPKSKYYTLDDLYTPFLQGNRTFGEKYPYIDTYTKKVTKLAPKNSILMSVRAPVGDLNIATANCCIGRGLCSINAINGDNEFIYYLLKHNIKSILNQGNGTTYDAINKDQVGSLEIQLPSENRDDLKKISNLLSNLDNKIENNNKINSELESMAKTIYDYWFLQFEFPNEEGKPYKSSGGKMIWNEELGREIPEGWEVGKVSSILGKIPLTKKYKSSEYNDGSKYPIIDQSSDFICGYTDNSREVLYMDDCIVFGDHTKYVKYINFPFARGADGTQIINSSNNKLSNYLLYRQILDMNLVSQGYSRYFKFLKDKYIMLPKKIISGKYMEVMKDIIKKQSESIIENRELSSLRDFLLPLLMNGQVGFKENIHIKDIEVGKEEVLT